MTHKEIKENRIGSIFLNYQGYEMTIIGYFNASNVTIRFNDEKDTIRKNLSYRHIKNGQIKNLYHPSVQKIGFMGEGGCTSKNNKKAHQCWNNMLKRCYNEKVMLKRPTYKNVTVCKEWHNFQNFAKWFDENYVENWELDKDLLIKVNKLYGPKNCCFLPPEINTFMTHIRKTSSDTTVGVSIQKGRNKFTSNICKNGKQVFIGNFDSEIEASEAYVKEKKKESTKLAKKWKNMLDEKAYLALLNWQV